MATSSSSLTASHSLFFPRAPKPHPNRIPLYRLTCGPHCTTISSSLLSRRSLFLPTAASAIWDVLTGGPGGSAREAALAVRRGMNLFREGDVSGSMIEFDRAIEFDPRQKAFEEGAAQFRLDVAANPNDTEESIWCYLCESQIFGVEDARKRFLEVGRDPRPVMREAYLMFKNGGDPKMLVSNFSSGREDEFFYASLYAGLYYESLNDTDSAKFHIIEACNSLYGSSSGDYMASLAKVHCLCRNWSLS
ncbi:Tetratricopeptide repeat (TPR)-like superfamily protein [Rhynchospora pubera]|uniref:Tetratricopeptide repeat (TPR)-like superfamily protein n=1 Tax=Rhynchospora pubera TaxID=906938 RepID=A0AAV8C6B0_9POAL|nr:Tetratricopeptide repeat (TPR)-like superfamily protein [Rhynchospora pubera]